MKKIKISILILLISVSFSSYSQSKIAHINTTELVQSMPDFAKMQTEIEKKVKEYETSIQDLVKGWEEKRKKYESEAPEKTPEENQKRALEIQGDEQSIRQYQAQAQQELQKLEFELLKPITEAAQNAINEVANELDFDFVLDSTQGQGVIVANGKDLMQDVKKKLGF